MKKLNYGNIIVWLVTLNIIIFILVENFLGNDLNAYIIAGIATVCAFIVEYFSCILLCDFKQWKNNKK